MKKQDKKKLMEFAKKIIEFREKVGLNIIDFAKELNCNRSTIWSWENGRTMPGFYNRRKLKQIAEKFNVNL